MENVSESWQAPSNKKTFGMLFNAAAGSAGTLVGIHVLTKSLGTGKQRGNLPLGQSWKLGLSKNAAGITAGWEYPPLSFTLSRRRQRLLLASIRRPLHCASLTWTGLNMEQGKENPLLAPNQADVHMDIHARASPAPLCSSLCSRAQRSKASPWMFSISPSEKATEVVQKHFRSFP